MTNLTDLLNPQGDASRVLIRYADRLLVVQHRDHHELLSLDENGATWSDNPARLREWHREVAAGHAAGIAASDAMVTEIRATTGYLRRARTLLGFKRMVGAVGPTFLHMQDSGNIPPGLTVCQGEDLERDPLYLGCANGVVDLNVGRLLPPEEGRRQLISRNTGVSFDPEAQDGAVDDLLTILSPPERFPPAGRPRPCAPWGKSGSLVRAVRGTRQREDSSPENHCRCSGNSPIWGVRIFPARQVDDLWQA